MEYVSQILLEVNGQGITDFKSVTENEVEIRKEVKLMSKTGVVRVQPSYGLQVEYVVPKDAEEFDFESVSDGSLTIDLNNGVRKQYAGVFTLKIGETKYDGENEATRTIDLVAEKRTIG